ncbi:MAG: hypothetical protein U0174_12045 [Polyangiaceae bacterium]
MTLQHSLTLLCPWVLFAPLVACGDTFVDSDHPCGTGTIWDGRQCVVKPVSSAAPTPTPQSPPGEVIDLGLRGKAPGPCSIVTKRGLPTSLEDSGTYRFSYGPGGNVAKMISRFAVKDAPSGFVEEPTTFTYDADGRISKIRSETGFGIVEGTYRYTPNGVVTTQKIGVIKDWGTYSTDWAFTYGNDGYVSGWTVRESQGDGAPTSITLRADGTRKRFVDCRVGSEGNIVPGVCWYEYDERARIAKHVATLEGNTVSTVDFTYDGDRYMGWRTTQSQATYGSRFVYDAYGNVAYIENTASESLPSVERLVYDYACWVGQDLPQPTSACGSGGKPDAFSVGSCFERLTAHSAQVY